MPDTSDCGHVLHIKIAPESDAILIGVQSETVIGSWQRPSPLSVGCVQPPALNSSATPSETKNTTFCGWLAVLQLPGEGTTEFSAGKTASKFVSVSSN
jgi:hypothetical protein